jgi:hypothetical protein
MGLWHSWEGVHPYTNTLCYFWFVFNHFHKRLLNKSNYKLAS